MREVHPDKNQKFTRDEMQRVTTQLASMWNNISQKELAECKVLAAKAKAEYEKEKSAIPAQQLKKLARAQKKPKGVIVVEAVGEKPVRAKTAYLIFCSKHRQRVMERVHSDKNAKFSRADMQQVTTQLAAMWNKIDANERAECKKLADKELERYHRLKKEYKAPIYGPAKKASGKASGDKSSKPKKPPTAYLLFAEDLRQKLKREEPSIDFMEISKRISESWKGISLERKKEYQRKADREAAKYAGDNMPSLLSNAHPSHGIEIITPQNYHGMLDQ